MEDSLQFMAFRLGFYLLGFVGLFGMTLLPLRAVLLLRGHWRRLMESNAGNLAWLAVAIFAGAAIALVVPLTARVFNCLTDSLYCGPNRGTGWIQLVGVGVLYLCFEVLAALVLWTERRFSAGRRKYPAEAAL